MSEKKQKLGNMMKVTGLAKVEADRLLKTCKWDLDLALDTHFHNVGLLEEKSKKQLFDDYKDEEDFMGAVGMERLCRDLELDPSDLVTIVLSWVPLYANDSI